MKQYIAIHQHKHGDSTYFFRSEADILAMDEEEIAEKLGIDFEPNYNEFLSISEVDIEANPII